MSADKDLGKFVDAHVGELLELVKRLIASPSMTPPGDERKVVGVLTNEMTRLGMQPIELVARSDERPNIIYRLKGAKRGPTLLLNGHTDTKPIGDPAAWDADPLQATVVGERMYGLGSSDMKSGCAALVYAVAALLPHRSRLRGDLLLVFTADEEGGGSFGADWLVTQCGLRADAGLIAEPAGVLEPWEVLPVLSRGTCTFTIRFHGTQMHSSIKDLLPSTNASVKMAKVLSRMEDELTVRFDPHPFCPQGVTVNAGAMVSGGVYYGITSGFAQFSSDVRILPGMTLQSLKQDVERFLDRMRDEDPELRAELVFERERHWLPAAEIPSSHPLVQSVSRAADFVLGKHVPLGSVPYATDARTFLHDGGIPTIPGFGPGTISVSHSPNEYVQWKEIISAAKIYALAAFDYLSGRSMNEPRMEPDVSMYPTRREGDERS